MTRTDSDVEFLPTTPQNPATTSPNGMEVISPREVPLGGLRAMTVRRTLPNRSRTLIGAWCFLDHYGPDLVAQSGGMSVAPHPHTGLQTVSWLFSGEIEHRDSTGAHALVTPGLLGLMTAGHGIQHSEVSTASSPTLHGVQLWVALPESARHQAPHFDSAKAITRSVGEASVTVFLGHLEGIANVHAPTYTPLVAAEISLPAHARLDLSLDPRFEYGLLVDQGSVTTDAGVIPQHHLGIVGTGHNSWSLTASDLPVRAVLVGGEPLREQIVMWWNFVGRTQDDIVQARSQWQEGLEVGSQRFGHLDHMPALPAPDMPNVTLKPRG